MDEPLIRKIVSRALAEGRSALTELEGTDVLDAIGLVTPRRVLVRGAAEARKAVAADGGRAFPGAKVVIKVVSAAILHKTEVGGVKIAHNKPADVEAAVAEMAGRFVGQAVDGYSINEFVPFEPSLGHEMIAGFRMAPDFGPVVSLGFGGIHAEFLAEQFRPGAATIFLSPLTAGRELIDRELSHNALWKILAGGLRGLAPAVKTGALTDLALAFVVAAPILASAGILEFEVNPFALAGEGSAARLVALDALAKIGPLPTGLALANGRIVNPEQEARPLAKIDILLRPKSAAVIGVSEKSINNGRIILRNLIRNGFDISRIYVVKPGSTEVDGCRCVPDVESLPEKVDLFVLVVPAAVAPSVLTELVEADKAQSVIVIPGGFEEKAGTEAITDRMKAALGRSRSAGGTVERLHEFVVAQAAARIQQGAVGRGVAALQSGQDAVCERVRRAEAFSKRDQRPFRRLAALVILRPFHHLAQQRPIGGRADLAQCLGRRGANALLPALDKFPKGWHHGVVAALPHHLGEDGGLRGIGALQPFQKRPGHLGVVDLRQRLECGAGVWLRAMRRHRNQRGHT